MPVRSCLEMAAIMPCRLWKGPDQRCFCLLVLSLGPLVLTFPAHSIPSAASHNPPCRAGLCHSTSPILFTTADLTLWWPLARVRAITCLPPASAAPCTMLLISWILPGWTTLLSSNRDVTWPTGRGVDVLWRGLGRLLLSQSEGDTAPS